jgi:hypothetical protein
MEPTITEYPLTAAHTLPLGYETHAKLKQLQAKIPASLQGMFTLEVTDMGGAQHLSGLRLQPDTPMEPVYKMLARLGEVRHRVRHGRTLSRIYRGEELEAILTDPKNTLALSNNPYGLEPYLQEGGRPVRQHYLHLGIPYMHSRLLDDAMGSHVLPQQERRLLKRIASEIPEDVRGAFVVHIVRDKQGLPSVHALHIAPNLAGTLLAESVLAPVAEMRIEEQPHRAKKAYSEILDIMHHFSGWGFDRAQMQQISEASRSLASRSVR